MRHLFSLLLMAILSVVFPPNLKAELITYVGVYQGEMGVYGRDWQYIVRDKDVAYADDSWMTASFDRSGWTVGEAPFGNVPDHPDFSARTHWPRGTLLYVYKEFVLAEPVDMTAYYAVDNGIDAYVNGELVRSVNQEGYTHYWEYKDELPASLFRKGINVLAFILEDHGTWTAFDFALRASRLGLPSQGGGPGNETPEPSTLLLLGLGGLSVLGYRRLRSMR